MTKLSVVLKVFNSLIPIIIEVKLFSVEIRVLASKLSKLFSKSYN